LFIETEKSVTSENVLDEVYYALEQDKMVIPVILHDSKTPFRLQRLQFIDFSKDYNQGLYRLIRTAVIKIQRAIPTELLRGITLAPFIYSFRFKKVD
jgi:hypothetical protein